MNRFWRHLPATILLLACTAVAANAQLIDPTGLPSGPSLGSAGPAPVAGAGDPIVGLPADLGTGNCYPFGCPYNAEYQQVYLGSQFTGTNTITDLEFFNTQFNSHATQTPAGTYTIDLSYTSAGPNSLSGNFASNIGADETTVFTGSINQPWAFGDTLTINLTTPFSYNPALGNLLMTVIGSGVTIPGGEIFFDTNSTTDVLAGP